jgi:hypothetical protein
MLYEILLARGYKGMGACGEGTDGEMQESNLPARRCPAPRF